MPAKKKEETAIEKTDVQSLIEAISTGNTEGVNLDALKALVDSMGLGLVTKGNEAVKGPSRTLMVQRWAEGETSLSEKEQETFTTLPEVIGTSKIADPAKVTQAEIDAVVREFVTLRDSEDPVKGRKAKIREDAIAVALARGGESTDLVSSKVGYKLAVTKKGGGPGEPQVAKLQELLSPEQWEAITVEQTTRVVDLTLLATALADPEVADAIKEVTPDVPVSYSLTPRALKGGEDV